MSDATLMDQCRELAECIEECRIPHLGEEFRLAGLPPILFSGEYFRRLDYPEMLVISGAYLPGQMPVFMTASKQRGIHILLHSTIPCFYCMESELGEMLEGSVKAKIRVGDLGEIEVYIPPKPVFDEAMSFITSGNYVESVRKLNDYLERRGK